VIELLCILAVWRVSSLLVNESGPFDLFAKVRHIVGVRYDVYLICSATGIAGAFCCLWCCSLWVSAFAALALCLWRGDGVFVTVINWLAFSAGAIVVESVVHRAN